MKDKKEKTGKAVRMPNMTTTTVCVCYVHAIIITIAVLSSFFTLHLVVIGSRTPHSRDRYVNNPPVTRHNTHHTQYLCFANKLLVFKPGSHKEDKKFEFNIY